MGHTFKIPLKTNVSFQQIQIKIGPVKPDFDLLTLSTRAKQGDEYDVARRYSAHLGEIGEIAAAAAYSVAKRKVSRDPAARLCRLAS